MWLLYALMASLTGAFRSILTRITKKDVPTLHYLWASFGVTGVFHAAYQYPSLSFQPEATLLGGIAGFLIVIASFCIVHALKNGDYSTITSLGGFGILCTLLLEWAVFRTLPDTFGFIGIFIVICGIYLLDVTAKSKNPIIHFKDILNSKYNRYALFGSFLMSASMILYKYGLTISASTMIVSVRLLPGIVLTGYLLWHKKTRRILYTHLPILCVFGLLPFIKDMFLTEALKLTLATYVTAVIRLDIVFGVIMGHIILHEHEYKDRLRAAVVVLAGVLCITLL